MAVPNSLRVFRIESASDLPLNRWQTFRKVTLTKAQPVIGPLVVVTLEGEYTLPPGWQGWIALDAGGNPYPIARGQFAAMYEEAAE